ncbi:MAG: class I SAM-dependent DNA methyltransferase [Calditrichia bacterium]
MQKSTADTPLPRPPYSAIAPIYDKMMSHVGYTRWAAYVKRVLQKENFENVDGVLDIGCGTGRFIEELQKLDIKAAGCEPAADMLALAKNRLPDSSLFHSGLPTLENIPEDTFHIATCLYDTMNYLEDEQGFIDTFKRVYEILVAPGIFIFDVVSPAHCQHYFQNYVDSEVVDEDYSYYRESHFDEDKGLQYNTIRVFGPEGIFQETHVQKIFQFEQIKRFIKTHTAFELAGCFEDFSFDPAGKKSGRAHFILKKNL